MSDYSPITPPPELVQQWIMEATEPSYVPTQAAQWGADRELEECCKWLPKLPPWSAHDLRRHRRPTPQPEPEGLTDEEIEEWADACSEAPLEEMDPEVHGWRRCFTAKEFGETIRAALARWGRPTPQLVEVAPLDKLDRLIALDRDNPTPEATNE